MTLAPAVFKGDRPLTPFERRVWAYWREGRDTAQIAERINETTDQPRSNWPRSVSEADVYNTLARLQNYAYAGEIAR